MSKRVVLFGATGGTGKILLPRLLASGYTVTAYCRNPSKLADYVKTFDATYSPENNNNNTSTAQPPSITSNLSIVGGELTDKEAIRKVIDGSDAVVSTLGSMGLFKMDRSVVDGIGNIVDAMKKNVKTTSTAASADGGVAQQQSIAARQQLIYMSSLGASESRDQFSSWAIRTLLCDVVLRVPLRAHTLCEGMIRGGGDECPFDYTIIRPSGLTDDDFDGKRLLIGDDASVPVTSSNPKTSRADVSQFVVDCLNSDGMAPGGKYRNKAVWMYY